ncbi:hypothetical protein [Micromonospora sp. NPDC005254]|uniref:hypothetical protein n=1 Tax=Micromonospora sp. NPDC005254 TaxID=3364229 RepID=UPI0036AC791E
MPADPLTAANLCANTPPADGPPAEPQRPRRRGRRGGRRAQRAHRAAERRTETEK